MLWELMYSSEINVLCYWPGFVSISNSHRVISDVDSVFSVSSLKVIDVVLDAALIDQPTEENNFSFLQEQKIILSLKMKMSDPY